MRNSRGILKYIAQVYVTALPKIIKSCTLGLVLSPQDSLRVMTNVLSFEDACRPDSVLGSKEIREVVPSPEGQGFDISLTERFYQASTGATSSIVELGALAYLCRATGAQRIFEIGTFIGQTTRILALNADPQAEVFTLDLPHDQVSHKIGQLYQGTPEGSRIRQHYGDSLKFDFSPWYDSIDFCWVDACHDYEYVLSDTKAAYKMVRVGGWLGWHDYRHTAWWSGVTRAVRETNKRIGGVVHLSGTTIALTQVSQHAKEIMNGGQI